ncbi:alanine dehydrogenase, partial [Bacillus spizizenii]
DDLEFGVQLGCNGIVHILFEYIDENSPQNPISLLEKTTEKRDESVIITLFSLEKRNKQTGTVGLIKKENTIISDSGCISESEL